MVRRPDPKPGAETSAAEREQRILRQVAAVAQRLLSVRPEQLDGEIDQCLRQAAEVAGADRCFLIVFGRRGQPNTTYEWIRPGAESQRPPPQPDSAAAFPWATARVTSGQPIVCPDPSELPDEAGREREALAARGVRSLLTLPLQPGGRVVGYQAFECLRSSRAWSEPEISLLRTMTEIFASSVIARRTETALRASDARFRAIADNAPALFVELDAEGRVLYVAPRVLELLGYRAEDALAGYAPSFFHDEDAAAIQAFRETLMRGGTARGAARVRHADGSWRWLEMTGRAFRNEHGEPRAVVVADDVTERRELREALRESRAQLFQSQKMEAVGRLAGGIAHDFNNLLLVIGGNVQEAADDPGFPAAARESMSDALDAIGRAATLTRQLLSFSRREMLDPRAVDLNEIVSALETLLRRVVGERIVLRVARGGTPAVVRSDRGQLEQVLMNLAVNARDAMPDGGELSILVETREVGPEEADDLGLDGAGLYHALVVGDTGGGIDPTAVDHIFEPFFTTKAPGEGTGLGLAIVYSVAKQAGGAVRVLAAEARGANFEVLLPAAEGQAEADEARPPRPRPSRGRLLLVEDEAAVRRLMTRMLERSGYETIVAADGEEALARAEEASIDLLVTDVVMPGLDGPGLARRLRERMPELPVLFLSGYPRDFHPADANAADAFLAKPFDQHELLEAVERQLDSRQPQRR